MPLLQSSAQVTTKVIKTKAKKAKPKTEKNSKINITTRCGNHITAKTIGAATLSLVIWPGLGQKVNKDSDEKVKAHAVFGLIGLFRAWSFYDALVDRKGGAWDGRI